jgi:error-prone DNA polymerase
MYLNCHSYHSLRYGTLSIEKLVEEALSCGVNAMALTDIHTVTGVYDFVLACQQHRIKPLVGMEFRNGNSLLYIGLVKNRRGLGALCRLRTKHNREETPLPTEAPAMNDVILIYPLEQAPPLLKDNEYIGIKPHQLIKLARPEWKEKISRMVILQPVTFVEQKEFNLHKILRAIDTNSIVSKLTPADHCDKAERMLPLDKLVELYKDFPSLLKNTEQIIETCTFEFDFKSPKNKKVYTDSRYSDKELLTRLALEGFAQRYKQDDAVARAKVLHELEVIDQLGFASYFLITWDIVQYSMSKGFLHIGRGSGANSIVSYCLGITNICPIELNLYFERFLNASRTSPPDFDIDWSWKDRDTILAYIFQRFGSEHVAFTGTIGEFKFRSIIRELGKVFGLAKTELDSLSKTPARYHDQNAVVKAIHEYGRLLEKHPNMRSMHACGILISEEPITNYTALEMPPKGFPVVQFDMHIAEAIGFEKFDILSQRGIGHINDCVEIIEKNQGQRIDIRNIALSKDEARCNDFLKQGKTIGCFYIESPAMRGLLRRLQCDNYKVLVAASSVIRPGVAKSGMMREYVFRHNNPGQYEYFHPVFEEQLGDTYGIMVYQEDVIKIAQGFAGLDPKDGDILRRAMSGKTRSKKEFDGVKTRYFENCKRMGHPDPLTAMVYQQIESFAGYSFCKAHSASYAIESYQSLYLKAYFPIEFMVSVINNFGGFYRTEVYVHEAKMAGAQILAPCVNNSEYLTTVYGKDVYLGFIHIHGLDVKTGMAIVEERQRNGMFESIEDFIERIVIGIESLQLLIFSGAFRFTSKPKSILALSGRMKLVRMKSEPRTTWLIKEPTKEYSLPALEHSRFEDAFDELEILGFPVCCSPFDLLQTAYRGDIMAKDLNLYHKKTVKMLGYLISRKEVPTEKGLMNFGTWIDVEGNYFDTAHFVDCLSAYPFHGGGCYLLLGRVEIDFHFPTITISKMAKLPFIPDPRYADDKDLRHKTHQALREDISETHRQPYPAEHAIGIPRYKMRL